jgi:hypothetical protein
MVYLCLFGRCVAREHWHVDALLLVSVWLWVGIDKSIVFGMVVACSRNIWLIKVLLIIVKAG